LEEEYEEKERLRSAEFHVQKSHMVKLEQHMRAKLQEVQKREAQLQTATGKLRTEKEQGDRQQQACLEQASLETRLLRQELDQTLKLEYKKAKKLAAGAGALEEEVRLWRSRYNELEEQFLAFRKQVAASEEPLESLNAELKIKQFEVTEVERKNSVIAASRDHFKNAVRTLLKELEKVEKERQRILLSPRSVGGGPPDASLGGDTGACTIDGDENHRRGGTESEVQDALRQIKRDLADLKDNECCPLPRLPAVAASQHDGTNHTQPSSPLPPHPVQPSIPSMASGWNDMRQELLNSGLYNSNDRMYKYLKA